MKNNDFVNLIYAYVDEGDDNVKKQILFYATEKPSLLVFPTTDKSVWDTCAKLLIELPYGIIKPNLVSILEYYQDINWPGVSVITNYLLKIPKLDLFEAISKVLLIAENDECWLFGLVSLITKSDMLNLFNTDDRFRKLILKSNYF